MLLEEVLAFHGPAIDEKGISIVREFDESSPLAMVDPHQMRQIFLNLLFNALDATPKGGIIRIATSSAPGGAVVRITDNGVGIPKDELPRVFDLFFTTKEKGTGLGLAICRKIIEDHGGTVSIRSSRGEGTEVELVVPVNNQ
jgi:signal transduction histidine kinase